MALNPLVSVKWLSENLTNPDLIILDASTKNNKSNLSTEFPDIQIKNSIPFNMETTFLDKESKLPNMMPDAEIFTKESQKLGINKDSIIVIYDNLGIYTSPRAWWMFKSMGHKNVSVLDGGLPAWKKAALPTESIEVVNILKPGDFVAHYQPNLVKDSNAILKNIEQKDFLVIDARSENRFSGSMPEPRAEMASGHIPNSINLPYSLVLEQGEMKSKKELEDVFKKLQLTDESLVFTCGSGVTACIILLASELIMENNKALFDGSWSEWGQLNKFPVEV